MGWTPESTRLGLVGGDGASAVCSWVADADSSVVLIHDVIILVVVLRPDGILYCFDSSKDEEAPEASLLTVRTRGVVETVKDATERNIIIIIMDIVTTTFRLVIGIILSFRLVLQAK